MNIMCDDCGHMKSCYCEKPCKDGEHFVVSKKLYVSRKKLQETIQQKAIEIDCPDCGGIGYIIKDEYKGSHCIQFLGITEETADSCPNCTNGKIKVIPVKDLEDKG